MREEGFTGQFPALTGKCRRARSELVGQSLRSQIGNEPVERAIAHLQGAAVDHLPVEPGALHQLGGSAGVDHRVQSRGRPFTISCEQGAAQPRQAPRAKHAGNGNPAVCQGMAHMEQSTGQIVDPIEAIQGHDEVELRGPGLFLVESEGIDRGDLGPARGEPIAQRGALDSNQQCACRLDLHEIESLDKILGHVIVKKRVEAWASRVNHRARQCRERAFAVENLRRGLRYHSHADCRACTGVASGAASTPVNWVATLRHGIKPLVDFVYPPRCPLCGDGMADQDGICAACWSQLVIPGEPCCATCQRPFPSEHRGDGAICAVCMADPPQHDGIAAATLYNDASRRLVLSFKHGGRIALAAMLARLIAARVPAIDEQWLVVPVPLHRWRLWRRGFNQSALLAGEVAKLVGGELAVDALVRRKPTPVLGGLGKAARRKALRGAIEVAGKARTRVAGRMVLLVDDVLTSGATTSVCVHALKRSGATSVVIACFARVLDESMDVAESQNRAAQNETPGAEAPGVA